MRHSYPPPLSTPVEVTADRSLGVNYQNDSGKLMCAYWSLGFDVPDVLNDTAWAAVYIGQTDPATQVQQTLGFQGLQNSAVGLCMMTVIVFVPAFWFYRVQGFTNGTGTVQKGRVIEVT